MALPPDASANQEVEAPEPSNPLDGPGESDDAEQADALVIPADERKLVTQPYDLGVRSIREDIRSGRISLNIAYQRKYVWDSGKASRLIESLLLNVPIPVCYFAEDDEGVYEVIDGLQRLTTIRKFLDDEFALTGVSVLSELNGDKFSDLAPRDQRRLESRTIRCIVITADSHPDIKFDVFERLNTGAASLTAQELRNSVYRGPFNDSLKELARKRYFTDLVGSFTNKRMGHEELVLRYLALVDGIDTYRPPLRQLLNRFMRARRKEPVLPEEATRFALVCETVGEVFGDRPFRAPGSQNPVNKALFDAVMVSVAYADRDALLEHQQVARTAFDALAEEERFQLAIGRATADRSRVLYRVAALSARLQEIGVPTRLPAALIEEGLLLRGT
ncbi:Protein of unknown function DUF262 [Leifsonia sp. 98AMF]|uniref:DUF262 domain-containing protein n=1 Tax=unclassified Leifsonia TaxID=2663824 RepID=UPI000879D775|nr:MULTISPECIES: DUF262 domain-containing protein [unclassified Leifsonia]SDH59781.1 Protein of unknown function DUF262 [Leifsonia sp. 197AMF]SDI79313.1 Protein of unknown function DUF262 [Leifsonia sp. 466MF]SDK06335.1 Protein of unknown function DUF262 [Leifsonia sp. 157MF]SDN82848.1 Protein of unknown function DUF262 [Leifsonia sp. 509MF]SEN24395.1 Protein of unknown function DUF262 [Leifsonia sp. 467MF]